MDYQFTEEDLDMWGYAETYFLQILNGEYTVEEAREDLKSLVDQKNNQPKAE
jgi:hypothetical protein